MTKSVITSRSENQALLNWLKSQDETSSFIEDTLNKVRTGEIVPLRQLEDEEELKRNYLVQRNRKLTKQCLQLDIRNRISLVTELKYSPDEANEIARGTKSIDDDDRLHCTERDCTWKLDYKPVDITVEVDHMIQHIKDEHHRDANVTEKKKFLELIA